MKKFVPYGKLSRKEQMRIDREKRGDWGAIRPVSVVFNTDKRRRRNKHRNKDFENE